MGCPNVQGVSFSGDFYYKVFSIYFNANSHYQFSVYYLTKIPATPDFVLEYQCVECCNQINQISAKPVHLQTSIKSILCCRANFKSFSRLVDS
jgi:hypothetical protein